jgi:uncharacterized protein YraI
MNRASWWAASRGVTSSAFGGTSSSSHTGDNGVGSVVCNRTDQIIRAQVRKQAPKRSNFQTWAHIIPVVNRNHEGSQTKLLTTRIASFNIHIVRYNSQVVPK